MDTFLKKGGSLEETVGRKCLCNGLVATIGAGQVRDNEAGEEAPILTSGDDLVILDRFLQGRTHYTAADVLDYLLGVPAGAASRSAHSLAEMPISVH